MFNAKKAKSLIEKQEVKKRKKTIKNFIRETNRDIKNAVKGERKQINLAFLGKKCLTNEDKTYIENYYKKKQYKFEWDGCYSFKISWD